MTPIHFLITDLHRGGSPLLLADLAIAMHAGKNFQPHVISIAPPGEIADLLHDHKIPVTSLFAKNNHDLSILPRLIHHLNKHQPPILCSILVHANILSALARPFLNHQPIYIHSIHTLQHRPRWHWYAQGLANQAADAFIAPSHAILQKLQAYGPIPQPFVIPNGLDTGRFINAIPFPQGQRRWPPNAFVVGYVGRFDPVKRLPRLIQAVASLIAQEQENRLPPIHLALVGYGQLDIQLRSLVHKLRLNHRIHFLGPSQTPERWYKTFDAFVMPSSAEGFSLAVIEANLAAAVEGKPRVLACDSPGIREAVDLGGRDFANNVSWLPPDPSVHEIAAALALLIAQPAGIPQLKAESGVPERCAKIPLTLAKALEIYSKERMVGQYERVFAALLGQRFPAPTLPHEPPPGRILDPSADGK